MEFREFRQFIHDSKEYKDKEMPLDMQERLHLIVGRFLFCARENPVYYDSLLKKRNEDVDDDELDADFAGEGGEQEENNGEKMS